MIRLLRSCGALAVLTGCTSSTGGDLFTFEAYAAAPAGVHGETSFVNGKGQRVTLTRARVLVGAVYLNRAVPTSVSAGTSCTLAGTYAAEVFGPLEVDALSDAPQPFPALGQATADRARTGEIWLTAGDVNDPNADDVILDVAGTVELAGVERPFTGALSIGANRLAPVPDAEPGLKPICKERIVSPIAVDTTPARGEHLALTVDARRMFANVDFGSLPSAPDGALAFEDDPGTATQASTNLYVGLRASGEVYTLRFER